jgi:hypothetical protein
MFIGGATIAIYAETQQFNTLDLILWLHIALFIWLSIRYSQLMLRAQIQDARVDSEIKSESKHLEPILDVGLIFSVPVLGFSTCLSHAQFDSSIDAWCSWISNCLYLIKYMD